MDDNFDFEDLTPEKMANLSPEEMLKMLGVPDDYDWQAEAQRMSEWVPSDFFVALGSPKSSVETIAEFLRCGSDSNEVRQGRYRNQEHALSVAVKGGNPDIVRLMLKHGANAGVVDDNGYSLILDAAHSHDIKDSPRLVELFHVLLDAGADPDIQSTYGEFALKSLILWARYDAIKILLEHGADTVPTKWTPLIMAVVFGTLDEVKVELEKKPDLESEDCWELTALMHALRRGDLPRISMLEQAGAKMEPSKGGRAHPLVCAMLSNDIEIIKHVLEIQPGFKPNQFNTNPISEALNFGSEAVVRYITEAFKSNQTFLDEALNNDEDGTFARYFLDQGANPDQLQSNARVGIFGYSDSDTAVSKISREDYMRAKKPRYGVSNPELIREPFWDAMIRARNSAYGARTHFGEETVFMCGKQDPDWCGDRFGQSITFLPDGRIIEAGGEHEDGYDPDFCIYNDVFEHKVDGTINIYGYPRDVFPPTDFHSATLVGDWIYLIGSLGYMGERNGANVQVYRLNTESFVLERIDALDSPPFQIYKHSAKLVDDQKIYIEGGNMLQMVKGEEQFGQNPNSFIFDTSNHTWLPLV